MSDIKKQLVKNSASTVLQIVASFISGLVLPPILIAELGFETYGIWGLIVLLNQYSMLLDFGLQSGFIKLTSEFFSKGNDERVNSLFSSNIILYFFVVVVITSLLLLMKEPAMQLFLGESTGYQNLYNIAFIYSIASLFNIFTFPFSSLLKGLQRYDVSNLIDIIFIIINAVSCTILVLSGLGLIGLVYGYCISLTLKFFLLILFTKKEFSQFRFVNSSMKMFEDLKLLFSYAPADLSVKIFSAFTQTLIRFSIRTYAGLVYVGIYDIAKRLVNQVLGLSSSIFVPFLPAMSSLSALNKRDEISAILKKAILYLNIFSLPVLFYLLFFFAPVLILWLNVADVYYINFAASILLIATLFDLFTGPITTSSIGFGFIRLQVIKLSLTCIVLSIFVIILGNFFGFRGIILAELIANLISLIFSTLFFDKLFGYSYTISLLKSIINISRVVLPVIIFFYIIWSVFNKMLYNNFIIFGIISFTMSIILIFNILIRVNIISKSDIVMLKNIMFRKN